MTPQRQVFTLPSFTTTSGRTLKNVRVGYETYGTLNAARDNAILICHYFSGTAHAAGKYRESDPLPGWWNAAIGPGKAIDTDRYFVVSSDSLCCVKVFDGQVVTTGPASIDPETGKPYGLDFPLVSVADMVHVQKALLDHLGIGKLAAVAGPSAGSVKAIQWAVEYPQMVERVIAVICPGLVFTPYQRSVMESWCAPIQLDPAWKNGAYDLKQQPLAGMTESFRQTFLWAISPAWVERMIGEGWADPARDPAASIHHQFKSYAGIGALAAMSTPLCDANHVLYMARAGSTYNVQERIGAARAKFLFIPAESDLLALPSRSQEAVEVIRAAGGRAELFTLKGDGGHFDGLYLIGQASAAIQNFLTSP
ncbi:MAG: homoserine O-acetyltransferase [Sphingomonadales bacterium]|nr:homoserine O-acetyltransferase [Sphingomonadales bacterium]